MNKNNNQNHLNKDTKTGALEHSTAHILATAVLEMFPEAKFGTGPATENGFYYDFDLPRTLIPEDLEILEEKMRTIIKANHSFEHKEISITAAAESFNKAKQVYKIELIEDLKKDGEKKVSIYKTGNFVDLCTGPHLDSTGEIRINTFKLIKISGAYWRADEKNPQMQRIYGVVFNDKKQLKQYLFQQEEAQKRDHRKLGKELDLFSFHQEGTGFPFWHPNGFIIYSELKNFLRAKNHNRGYSEIKTPPILSKELWVTSGHWGKFKDDMYFTKIDDQEYAIKPMNCPGGLLVYKNTKHSYRELPIRNAEFGLVHRHEKSGVLHGLFRARSFTQDDAHSFCNNKQLKNELANMVDYALDVYNTFDFKKYEVFIATRPEKYIGSDEEWTKATDALVDTLKTKKISYKIKTGEGAFYGPKIEFNIKDSLNRNWQCGTIQIDFSMPKRFNARYIDKDGKEKTPIMIHRAIVGSLERFIGILIEHFAGSFPLWLSPLQVSIVPVSEKFNDYAKEVQEKLLSKEIRAEINSRDESLGKRIREEEKQKNPYILVVGEKEMKDGAVAVRARNAKNKQEVFTLDKFIEKILGEIKDKIMN